MVFNSLDYAIFFAVVAFLHFALPHRLRTGLLLVASYVFYMWWNAAYALLILASTAVDYLVGLRMPAADRAGRRRLLLASLGSNLGLLFTFKYWNFAADSGERLLAWLGVGSELPHLDVLLPVGISFYTFQTLSYTIDLYRSRLDPERSPTRFALYVAFFPQLVAGPIERAVHLIPQLHRRHEVDGSRIASGLQLALWGLFKKVVIADRLALYVDAVYGNVAHHGATTFLFATYAFALQIYCDFSGYSDIAIGSARVLGFDLMKNFERPYFATTITAFWRRWHISLSTWLRDYLYIPLGGNRHGTAATYRNLLLTMLLGGLWHGASFAFVAWGALHGVLLSLSRATLPIRDRAYRTLGVPDRIRDALRILVTFHLVCAGWVFFRAESIRDALHIFASLAGPLDPPFVDAAVFLHALPGALLLLAVQLVQERRGSVREQVTALPAPLRWAGWYALLAGIALLGVDGGSQFIYFQF